MKNKDYQYVVTVPVNTTMDMQTQHKTAEEELRKYLAEGYVVTHITSSVLRDNMFVYHWLEKETK